MKKIQLIIITILLISTVSSFAADWRPIRFVVKEDFQDIHFIDQKLGFAGTRRGNIYELNEVEGGWRMTGVSEGSPLDAIHFTSTENTGYATGLYGFLRKSTDLGKSWEFDTLGASCQMYDINFLNENIGFIIGRNLSNKGSDNGIILKTENAAQSWDSVEVSIGRVRKIDFSSIGNVYILGDDFVLKSSDTGKTWSKIILPETKSARGISMMGDYGIIVGMRGYVAVTSDGGENWEARYVIPEEISLMDVILIDRQQAFAVGGGGQIVYTHDGGENWIPEISGVGVDLVRIQKTGKRLYICGSKSTIVFADISQLIPSLENMIGH